MKRTAVISSLAVAFAASLALMHGLAASETAVGIPAPAEYVQSFGAEASPIVLTPEAGKEAVPYNAGAPTAPYVMDFEVNIPEIADAVNVRVTYATSETAAHELLLYSGNESTVLVHDTSISRGGSVTSETADLPEALAKKIAENGKFSISFSSAAPDAVIKLEKLVFSFSEEQAYSYFGDTRKVSSGGISIGFGPDGNAGFYGTGSDGTYGQHMYFEIMDSLMINRCKTPYRGSHYMSMIKFARPEEYNSRYDYIRILYKAVTVTDDVDIKLYNNKSGEFADLGKAVVSDGFVLTDPVRIPEGHTARYADGIHCTLTFDDPALYSNYFVRKIYFFKSYEDASLFTATEARQVPITVMGRSISDYSIVIPSDASFEVKNIASELKEAIKEKSGCEIRVVDSKSAATDAEIVLGYGIRGNAENVDLRYTKARVTKDGIFFDALSKEDLQNLVTRFSELYFEIGKASDSEIVIDDRAALTLDTAVDYTGFPYPAAAEPLKVGYSFNTPDDMEYWNDPDGAWTYGGKVYRCSSDSLRVAESRLYDTDISLDLTFALSSVTENSSFGVMLRKNGDDSYVKLEYSPTAHMLTAYVRSSYVCREVPVAQTGLLLCDGLEYSMKVSLTGTRLTVSIGNITVLECDGIYYTAPGKAALFAKGLSVSVGKCDGVLYSEIGRVLGDAIFNETVLMKQGGDSNYRIPSLIATNSGTLIAAANDRRYTLADRAPEQWLVIRRKPLDGEWEELRVLAADSDTSYVIGSAVYDDINDVIFILFSCSTSNQAVIDRLGTKNTAMIAVSRDDGITWEIRRNTVLANSLGLTGHAHGANAGFTIKYGEHAGRLITAARTAYDHSEDINVLRTKHYNCTLYSDDGGLTWQTGGLVQPGTGEGALMERTDGTLVLNSRAYFNDHLRRVAYSEDGGETFGGFETSDALLEPLSGVNASILRAETGCGQTLTLFSNPYPDETMLGSSSRRNMTVCLSYDEGRSWVTKKTAHAAFSAYSCLTYNEKTDTFFLFYESGPTNSSSYDNISVIEFNLEWLLAN